MGLISEVRSRVRHVVVPVLWVSAVAYFAYHAVQGDRGLIAWLHLKQRVADTRAVAVDVSGRRMALERRVRSLHPESLDPDMLDERARVMLNVGSAGDIVIPFRDASVR